MFETLSFVVLNSIPNFFLAKKLLGPKTFLNPNCLGSNIFLTYNIYWALKKFWMSVWLLPLFATGIENNQTIQWIKIVWLIDCLCVGTKKLINRNNQIDFWIFGFDFLITYMSYFIEGQWKTDKDNRMSGHMIIIPFPVKYLCRNSLNRAKTTKI